jgi:hypothetical protein
MPDQESERLKRLRERQLKDRDPLAGERKFQHASSVKEKRMYKPLSFKKEWADFPHIVKIPVYCLILGIIIMVVLRILWNSPYAIYIGAGVMVFIILLGAIAGNILDYRDKIKYHIK